MKAMMLVLVVTGAACTGFLACDAPAGARPLHHRAAAHHHRGGRGEATFPITAGSSQVKINAVGEVITSDNGRGPIQPARGNGKGK